MSDPVYGFSYYAKSKDGVEVALTVPLLNNLGLPLESPGAIADYCAGLVAALAQRGFVRSERLDKPAGGWGGGKGQQQAKPEAPPPPDLVVPVHCDLNMVYIPARERDGKDAVAAHWDCRKRGTECSEGRLVGDRSYPFTDWHLTKKPVSDTQDAADAAKAPSQASPATKPSAPNYTAFWRMVAEHGLPITQSTLEAYCDKHGLKKPQLTTEHLAQIINDAADETVRV